MKLAIVGVTGLVGETFLKVLAERNFPISELIPVASERSVGKEIQFNDKKHTIVNLKEAISKKPDIALFSAGSELSIKWAQTFAKNNCFVIDNSSAWRMDQNKKLIIPEINAHLITRNDKIIANPNCSAIQMLLALAPLHVNYSIKRIVVSTYQSISGTGQKAIEQYNNEREGIKGYMVYPHPIDKNCLPHCDSFFENGYTKEELKLVNETKKILDPAIEVTVTAVRVPVIGGHSESVNIEFNNEYDIKDVYNILSKSNGIQVMDDPEKDIYPMPIFAHHKDEVFVGRIRRDHSQNKSLNMWIVADNLRKGAATNAVQIAEYLISQKLV